MFRRSHHPASRLSNSEMKKLEQLFLMVDSCTVDMGGGSQDSATARQLADAINGYPNATIVYEVMRRVRKCFKASNPRVIIRALNLTDVLMQSCGAHVRREVGSEKFLKVICKLCKVTKTKLDPAWQTVAIRAQELLAGWAESSEQTLGSGNRFTQAYNNLRRDGVQFRNTSGVGIGGGGRGSMDARNSFRSSGGSFRGGRGGNFMGGSFRGGSGGSFRGGDSGGSFRGGSGGSFRGGDSGGSFRGGDNGDNLAGRSGSRSPGVGILQPGDLGYDEEAELAQAIMESSLSVTENGGQGGGHRRTDSLAAAAEDGDLLSMVPPTIEALMDIMESSRDLSELLDNDAAPDVVDQTRGLVEQVIKKVEELERDGNPDEKDMDRYLKAHDDLQTVLRVYEGVLDGKETLPLPNSDSGGAKNALGNGHRQNGSDDDESLVAGGISKGAKMPRSRGRGGETESDSGGRASPATGNLLDLEENAPLEAGAGGMLVAFDPGQFNATHIRGGSGSAAGFDSSSSVAQGSTTASNFPSETGAVYGSNAAASSTGGGGGGGDSGAGFAPTDLFASFGSAPGSDAPQAPDPNHAAIISVRTSSSRAPRKTPPSQQPSDFGSWMSSVRGVGSGGDPFAPSPASGYANGVGGRLPVVSESASFASSNGGGGSGSGGSNPFGTPQSMSSTRSGFPALDWQASAGQGIGQAATGPAVAAPKADSLDPFSVGYGARGSWTQSGSRSSTGGLGMRAHDGTLNSTSTSTSTSSATLASGSSAFSNFSSASPKQPVPAPPPMQQSLPQQQQQQPAMWWQHQPIQPQKAKQQRADPFGGSVLPVGGAGSGGGGIPSSFATGPFAQLTATSTGVSAGTGHSATGSGDSGAFSQALVVHEGMDGGMVGGDNGGRKKSNPFDDPSGTTFGVPQQQQPRSQQQQQPQPQQQQQQQPLPQQQQPQPQSQQQQQPRPQQLRPQQQPQPQQQQQQQPRSQQHQPRPQQLRPQQHQPRPQQQQPRPQQQQQPRPQQQQPQPQSQQQQQPRPQQLRPQQQQSFHQVGQGYQQQPWSQQPQRRQSQQLLQVPFQQVNQQPQFQRHGQVNQQPQQQQQQQQQPPQQPANRQHPNQHYV